MNFISWLIQMSILTSFVSGPSVGMAFAGPPANEKGKVSPCKVKTRSGITDMHPIYQGRKDIQPIRIDRCFLFTSITFVVVIVPLLSVFTNEITKATANQWSYWWNYNGTDVMTRGGKDDRPVRGYDCSNPGICSLFSDERTTIGYSTMEDGVSDYDYIDFDDNGWICQVV